MNQRASIPAIVGDELLEAGPSGRLGRNAQHDRLLRIEEGLSPHVCCQGRSAWLQG
jgi:hypothetical protein